MRTPISFALFALAACSSPTPARELPAWDPTLPPASVMGVRRGLTPARGIVHLHSPFSSLYPLATRPLVDYRHPTLPKNPVEDYLVGCALTRSTGAATDETAYDSVLKALLDAAGHGLKPQGCLTTKSPWTASRPRCASASAWSASRPRRIVAASLRFGLRTTAHEAIGKPGAGTT